MSTGCTFEKVQRNARHAYRLVNALLLGPETVMMRHAVQGHDCVVSLRFQTGVYFDLVVFPEREQEVDESKIEQNAVYVERFVKIKIICEDRTLTDSFFKAVFQYLVPDPYSIFGIGVDWLPCVERLVEILSIPFDQMRPQAVPTYPVVGNHGREYDCLGIFGVSLVRVQQTLQPSCGDEDIFVHLDDHRFAVRLE